MSLNALLVCVCAYVMYVCVCVRVCCDSCFSHTPVSAGEHLTHCCKSLGGLYMTTRASIASTSPSGAGTFESIVGANSQFPLHVRRQRIRAMKCLRARIGSSFQNIR